MLWLEGFNGTLTSVVTLAAGKRGVKCGPGTVYDTSYICMGNGIGVYTTV